MKQQDLRARPKWHQRASPSEIDEVAGIDGVIDDLRRRRGKIINRVNMRTDVWMSPQTRRKGACLPDEIEVTYGLFIVGVDVGSTASHEETSGV